ncbi:TonB-dependent receptor plug domain-containing protein [Gimibacter soli]|uniref:TonB-dependent receptor n=1 Tax=Gimibacter soli TaxID=3024400 RepID=A0AAE9XMZ9_9PROT|nr:TonB-dependent receptor [Gimibacter soli]WCL53614.1 TonB-dependent receptor [Gimibacter soli]
MEEIFGEPVTEGATGTPKRASEVPVNMTIISADEIRRSGARDVMEILRRHVGLDVQRATQTSGNVSVRGLNIDGGRLRVLINGRDTYRTYEGTTQWASLPVALAEIRQIEIVRGPATALYGANAVTGVVNIVTYDPLYDEGGNVTARIGNNGVREVAANAIVKLGPKAGVRISGGYFDSDAFDAPLTPSEALLRLDPGSHWISVDAGFQLSDTIQASLEFSHLGGDVNSLPYLGTLNNSEVEDYAAKGTLTAETAFGRWTATAIFNSNEETRYTALTIPTGVFLLLQKIEAETRIFDVTNMQMVGADTALRLSAGYRQDKAGQFGMSAADGTGDVGYDTYYAAFLIDRVISSSLTFDLSARYDYISTFRTADMLPFLPFTNDDYGNYDAVSANAGLSWKPTDADTLKLMYARGFLAPTIFTLGGQIVPNSTYPGIVAFGGSPNVEPTISTQFELLYERDIPALGASFSAAIFHRKDSSIHRSVVLGGLYPLESGDYYVGTAVIGDAKTWGLELDLSGKTPEGIYWALRYGFADTSETHDFEGGIGPVSDAYALVPEHLEDRSSKHILTANIGFERETGFYGDILVQYKSGYDSFSGFALPPTAASPYRQIDGTWVGNANLGYKFEGGWRLFVTGEGLFNAHRYEHVAPQARLDRRFWAGVSFDF